MPEKMTKATCSLCKSKHPAWEGITHFENVYHCPCGTNWIDEWCCGVDDDCPSCGMSCSPSESTETAFIEPEKE